MRVHCKRHRFGNGLDLGPIDAACNGYGGFNETLRTRIRDELYWRFHRIPFIINNNVWGDATEGLLDGVSDILRPYDMGIVGECGDNIKKSWGEA